MDDTNETFTIEQAGAANRALRDALGLPPERFGVERFVGMLSDEIEQLRAAGKSDEEISGILARTANVSVAPDAIARFYATPAERGRPAGPQTS